MLEPLHIWRHRIAIRGSDDTGRRRVEAGVLGVLGIHRAREQVSAACGVVDAHEALIGHNSSACGLLVGWVYEELAALYASPIVRVEGVDPELLRRRVARIKSNATRGIIF